MSVQNLLLIECELVEKFQFQDLSADDPCQSLVQLHWDTINLKQGYFDVRKSSIVATPRPHGSSMSYSLSVWWINHVHSYKPNGRSACPSAAKQHRGYFCASYPLWFISTSFSLPACILSFEALYITPAIDCCIWAAPVFSKQSAQESDLQNELKHCRNRCYLPVKAYPQCNIFSPVQVQHSIYTIKLHDNFFIQKAYNHYKLLFATHRSWAPSKWEINQQRHSGQIVPKQIGLCIGDQLHWSTWSRESVDCSRGYVRTEGD